MGLEADASSAAAPPPADDAGVLKPDASEPSSILRTNDEKANRRKGNELAKNAQAKLYLIELQFPQHGIMEPASASLPRACSRCSPATLALARRQKVVQVRCLSLILEPLFGIF